LYSTLTADWAMLVDFRIRVLYLVARSAISERLDGQSEIASKVSSFRRIELYGRGAPRKAESTG